MVGAKFFEHKVRRGELFDRVGIRGGHMFLDEPSKDAIISTPNVVGIASSGLVRAREGTVEPDIKAMAESEEEELVAPFNPVGFTEIKNQALQITQSPTLLGLKFSHKH